MRVMMAATGAPAVRVTSATALLATETMRDSARPTNATVDEVARAM